MDIISKDDILIILLNLHPLDAVLLLSVCRLWQARLAKILHSDIYIYIQFKNIVYNKAKLDWYPWTKLPVDVFRNPTIVNASKTGDTELLQLLLKCKPEKKLYNMALILAIENHHTEAVKILLNDPNTNPKRDHHEFLILAIEKQNTEIVKVLLEDPTINTGIKNNVPVYKAIDGKNVEILKILLQHPNIDPTADKSDILRYALKNHKADMVDILLEDDRILKKLGEHGILRNAVSETMSGKGAFSFHLLIHNDKIIQMQKSSQKSKKCTLF
jgi:hypothetical protein